MYRRIGELLMLSFLLLTALSLAQSSIRQALGRISAFTSSVLNGIAPVNNAVDHDHDELTLPEDVLVEILSRLAPRTLLQLKSVCRRWNATISSPHLISAHLRNYTNGPAGSASQTLMLCECPHYSDIKAVKLLSPDHHGDQQQRQRQLLETPMAIVPGPCNGVFLMAPNPKIGDFVRLWNPATRKCREIAVPPPPRKKKKSTIHHYNDSWGFGLDPVANDFKIVLIRHFCLDEDYERRSIDAFGHYPPSNCPSQVLVYTPGSNAWKELEELRLEVEIFHFAESYRYLDGFFFWTCVSPVAVLAFDLGNDVFRVVNDPVHIAISTSCFESYLKQLLVYRAELALFVARESDYGTGYDMWLLSTSEEEWCWIKHLCVGPFIPPVVRTTAVSMPYPDMFVLDPYMAAVAGWRDDQLVVVKVDSVSLISELLLFDPVTQATKVIKDDVCGPMGIFVYRESLVSVGVN